MENASNEQPLLLVNHFENIAKTQAARPSKPFADGQKCCHEGSYANYHGEE